MSFEGTGYSLDNAARRLISAGVTVVAAAGNDNEDAGNSGLSRVDEALIVSATDSSDTRGRTIFGDPFANYGAVVDLFAPGVGIESTSHTSDTDTTHKTGTSMAAPHVAGVAAQFLQANPLADPDAVQGAIKNSATRDHVVDPGEDTPNRLLYSLTNSTLMSETSVIVRESDYDVDTGIDISPGQWATIKVSGQIYSGWWFSPPNGPEGWDSIQDSYDYPLPGSRPYSLVGKLGTSYFYIGRSNASIYNPFQTQRLYLRINDDAPGNGYGEFYCRVQVWRKLPSAEATFVFQAAPTVMTPGQTASVTVTMQNTGETAWTAAEGYQLGSQNPQDNQTWGINRVMLPNSVPPGSQATFTFNITAPSAPGIYNFQWRMVQDGVEWFGDITQNRQITIPNSGNLAQFISQVVPRRAFTGETLDVSVTMKNIGSTTWTAGTNYRLGSQNPQDNLRWGINRVALPHSVPPGSQVTFTFTVPAPGIAGNYSFQWRMVQDGVEWFGDYTPNLIVFVRDPL
jgi:hypothetical protein